MKMNYPKGIFSSDGATYIRTFYRINCRNQTKSSRLILSVMIFLHCPAVIFLIYAPVNYLVNNCEKI